MSRSSTRDVSMSSPGEGAMPARRRGMTNKLKKRLLADPHIQRNLKFYSTLLDLGDHLEKMPWGFDRVILQRIHQDIRKTSKEMIDEYEKRSGYTKGRTKRRKGKR
jgi:hypothetical protein